MQAHFFCSSSHHFPTLHLSPNPLPIHGSTHSFFHVTTICWAPPTCQERSWALETPQVSALMVTTQCQESWTREASSPLSLPATTGQIHLHLPRVLLNRGWRPTPFCWGGSWECPVAAERRKMMPASWHFPLLGFTQGSSSGVLSYSGQNAHTCWTVLSPRDPLGATLGKPFGAQLRQLENQPLPPVWIWNLLDSVTLAEGKRAFALQNFSVYMPCSLEWLSGLSVVCDYFSPFRLLQQRSQTKGLINNQNLFLRVLEARCLRSGCQDGGVLVRILFQVVEGYLLIVFSYS